MSGLTILALVGLCMWCGALSRRSVHTVRTAGCMPGGTLSTDEVESQVANLTDAYSRLETDMTTRVTELEERLDFAERMLAEQRQRAHLGVSAYTAQRLDHSRRPDRGVVT